MIEDYRKAARNAIAAGLANAPLNEPNPETFYTQGAEGYTGYPMLDRAAAAQ